MRDPGRTPRWLLVVLSTIGIIGLADVTIAVLSLSN